MTDRAALHCYLGPDTKDGIDTFAAVEVGCPTSSLIEAIGEQLDGRTLPDDRYIDLVEVARRARTIADQNRRRPR